MLSSSNLCICVYVLDMRLFFGFSVLAGEIHPLLYVRHKMYALNFRILTSISVKIGRAMQNASLKPHDWRRVSAEMHVASPKRCWLSIFVTQLEKQTVEFATE